MQGFPTNSALAGLMLLCGAVAAQPADPARPSVPAQPPSVLGRLFRPADPDTPDFDRDVRPILEARCLECHGPTKRKGGLRLSSREDALRGGESGAAIVPGDGAASPLYKAIADADPDNFGRMPPEGPPLSTDEIEVVRRWIEAGAVWPDSADAPAEPNAPMPEPAGAAPEATDDDAKLLAELAAWPAATSPVDFARDVFPVLETACFECHGPAKQKSRLRLDSRGAALRGGLSGPAVVPGDAAKSALLHRVAGIGLEERMPPGERPALSPEAVGAIRAWIEAGAVWPENLGAADDSIALHWSFRAPVAHPAPAVRDAAAVRDPIDAFVLARLEREGIAPSPEADRATLIRRMALDLTGILPTPEEVDAFVADPAPDAVERLADRLLASPHFGERWARHWLDAARYADSNGYSIDGPRDIWAFRDWTIRAFNDGMPFDRFAIEQLAGDLLPDASVETRVATGFHRNTMVNQEGGVDPEEFRIEAVHDRVATTGEVFLGLTIGCAQCHNHKFDPIPQRDYYAMFAFFNDDDEPTIEVASAEESVRRDALRAQIRALEAELRDYDEKSGRDPDAWLAGQSKERLDEMTETAKAAARLPAGERSEEQTAALAEEMKEDDPGRRARVATIEELKKREPKFPTTLALKARSEPRETRLLIAGDFTRPGEPVEPGTPSALPPMRRESEGRPTRLDLARWIVSRENPMTARVVVNRYWQRLFGIGLVETENDFGTQGSLPTHPELLDRLAVDFMESGWDTKGMLRRMVLSSTYRRASRVRPDLAETDPNNRLLARQNRLRLDAEIVRDVALAASGLLSPKIGGPSVFPPIPEGVMSLGQVKRDWKTSAGEDRYRRGMYTYFWRGVPHPSLVVFDAPNAQAACTRRARSNTPLQALTLLNDEAFHECATALARRALAEPVAEDAARIRRAFRLCLGREPDAFETETLLGLIDAERRASAFESALGGGAATDDADAAEATPPTEWILAAKAILNLDEFLVRE